MLSGDVVAIPLLWLALRLLLLARRTRKLPELLIGGFFLTSVPGAMITVRAIDWDLGAPTHHQLAILGLVLLTVGGVLLTAFTGHVFRAGDAWARVLAGAIVVALALGCYLQARELSITPRHPFILSRAVCFGWTFFESLRYHLLMRRRLRIGLADPVVANRFLLCALWTGPLTLIPLLTLGFALLAQVGPGTSWQTAFQTLMKVAGVCMLLAVYLSFLPPRPYLAWLRRRHPESAIP